MSNRLALISITALSLGLAGCGHKASQEAAADNSVATSDSMAGANDTMATDANAADANMASSSAAPVMTGQEFANAAAAGDAFEIAEAKLASAKGKDQSVKDFAAKMKVAHTESTAKIKKAAGEASPKITPDPTMTADQKTKLDALGKLSGDGFDKQYAADQADAHHMALAAMQGYAASGDVPSLKTAAGEIAPIVSSHVDMIKKLPGQ